jgi:cyclopropane-fatty-acyl-phospholipid synthase
MSTDRSIVHSLLSHIRQGHLVLRDPEGSEHSFGTPDAELSVVLVVHNPLFYKRIVRDGSLGLGEGYMQGYWDVENDKLMECIAIFLLNKLERKVKMNMWLSLWVLKQRWFRLPNWVRSKSDVSSHYDVGNDLYENFLDENMSYTCAYQYHPTDSIEQMQNQKHERVCRKLALKPGEHIADLGCGYGAMLIYAAQHYGITGVGATLSREQVEWGNAKITELGLSDQIHLELKDYRDLEGVFDKIVSLGLLEHTFHEGYHSVMKKISSLLPVGGSVLMHSCGTREDPRNTSDPWINKHIFPGGRLPRLEELALAARRVGFSVGHYEDLKPHYAETLRLWHKRYNDNLEKIRGLKVYNEVFIRKWRYYLQACEAAFRYGTMELHHLLCCKGDAWTLPVRLNFGESSASE